MEIAKIEKIKLILAVIVSFVFGICLIKFDSSAAELNHYNHDYSIIVDYEESDDLVSNWNVDFDYSSDLYFIGFEFNRIVDDNYKANINMFILSKEPISDYTNEYNGFYYIKYGVLVGDKNPITLLTDFEPLVNIDSLQNLEDILKSYIDDGTIERYKKDLSAENPTEFYLPTPILTFEKDSYKFSIDNAAEDYFIEIKGRWYSADDIYLYKEKAMWKYKYSTYIKSDLSNWVSISDRVLSGTSARHSLDLTEYGLNSFNMLLHTYPIDNRHYMGGSNPIGEYLSGYNDALVMLKEVLLPNMESYFNGCEIYIRFVKIVDDGYQYSRWCHWYDTMSDPDGGSGSKLDNVSIGSPNSSKVGLTDEQLDTLESSNNSRFEDTDIENDPLKIDFDKLNIGDLTDYNMNQFFRIIKNLVNSMGVFPDLINTVFGFLPSWLINMIAITIAALVVLRILGR